MATYAGGTQVRSGYYFDPMAFSFVNVPKDGGTLPGGEGARFVAVPFPVVLGAAPILGGLFVVSLPFLGLGVTAWAIGRALSGAARSGAAEVAATVAPPWAPGEAHLAGKAPESGPAAAAGKDEKLEALQKEVEEKRAR
jgi:hypothetical protein